MMAEATTIQDRLTAARKREREARAEAMRLRRALAIAERKKETQRLCVLGRAWTTLAEQNGTFREQGQRFLGQYVVRETDVAALKGSPFDVSSAPGESS